MNLFAKLGAITYVVWGLLHIQAAWGVYKLGQSLEPGMVQARVFQDAWFLLFSAVFGIVVAVIWNWRNSRLGFWLNAVVVSAGDIGFVLFVLVPGLIPLVPGGLGPLLWIVALVLTAIATFGAEPERSGYNS